MDIVYVQGNDTVIIMDGDAVQVYSGIISDMPMHVDPFDDGDKWLGSYQLIYPQGKMPRSKIDVYLCTDGWKQAILCRYGREKCDFVRTDFTGDWESLIG